MFSKVTSNHLLLIVLIFLSLFTRLIGISWGNGYFFHPDENNMASAITNLNWHNFNPHFFAYGQFPLYLAFFSYQIYHFLTSYQFSTSVSFPVAIYTLRVYSAIFSLLTLVVVWLISKRFLPSRYQFMLLLFLIFSPGLIQLAHFGTTESLLILIFSLSIYFSLRYYENPKTIWVILSGIIVGVGFGSKITALVFALPFALVILNRIIHRHKIIPIISHLLLFIICFSLFTFLSSPYNFLNFSEFLSSMNYETGVATGRFHVFYTSQYLNSQPYLFQFLHIFPYALGLPVFVLSLLGLFFSIKQFRLKKFNFSYLLLFLPALVYFLYVGQLYAKWFRFSSPVFFLIPFLAVFFIMRLRSSTLQYLLVFMCILPGILFMNMYLTSDIRFRATEWLDKNISPKSFVLSEGGNVVDLPLQASPYHVTNLDFYDLDTNPEIQMNLVSDIFKADYIFVPSRRIFKNQNNTSFPYSQRYYQNLFSGRLGFLEIKEFTPDNYLFLNPENAEETFSVFDHPTIRVFKKIKQLPYSEYQSLLFYDQQK